LAFASYFGGSGNDRGYAVAPDGAGGAWITGQTFSTDLPTQSGSATSLRGPSDVFVANVAANGTLAYVTYFGGDSRDSGYGVAADGTGGVWLTGTTSSADLPTPGGFDNTLGAVFDGFSDAFIARFLTNGTLSFSSYFGGLGIDGGSAVASDGTGGVWLTGTTSSADLPTPGGFDTTYNDDGDVSSLT
jgi:hypothetical protein